MLGDSEQRELGLRLRRGNADAWAALYDGFSVDVWRLVSRLIGPDAASVADVVQEVFLAAAQSAENYDPDRGALWSWLGGIAHRQVSLYWRHAERAGRWRKLAKSVAWQSRLETAEPHSSSEAPDAIWQRAELADLVRSVLAELSADHALLLAAKYLDDRTLDELSREHGTTVDATKSKLARARREFRATFQRISGSDKTAHFP